MRARAKQLQAASQPPAAASEPSAAEEMLLEKLAEMEVPCSRCRPIQTPSLLEITGGLPEFRSRVWCRVAARLPSSTKVCCCRCHVVR